MSTPLWFYKWDTIWIPTSDIKPTKAVSHVLWLIGQKCNRITNTVQAGFVAFGDPVARSPGINDSSTTIWIRHRKVCRGKSEVLWEDFPGQNIRVSGVNSDPLQSKLIIPPTHRQQLQYENPSYLNRAETWDTTVWESRKSVPLTFSSFWVLFCKKRLFVN